jgi:23S rRNA (guanosine2251-2'-O)-methyltransferase
MAIIYGVNPVLEQMLADPGRIDSIHLPKGPLHGQLGRVARQARELNIHLVYVDRKTLNRLAEGGVHQGVVARTSEYAYTSLPDLLKALKPDSRVIMLDGIEDPQNLGAVVRTSVCTGAAGVIIPERHAAGMSAGAIKASAGAANIARVCRVTNLARTLEAFKQHGLWNVAVEAGGERDVRELDHSLGYCLVFGSEGRGIRRLVRGACDMSAQIPMPGAFDSLNVSVAVGVALYAILP